MQEAESTYNNVTFRPYKIRRTLFKAKADIVLESKKDISDYLALGIFLLAKSIEEKDCEITEKRKIYVCYSKDSFAPESGCSILVNRREFPVPGKFFQDYLIKSTRKIIDFLYGVEIITSGMLAITFFPDFYGVVAGYFRSQSLEKLIPEKFSMKDAISAQKFANDVVCNRLDELFPYAIEMIRAQAQAEKTEEASKDQK